MLRRLVVLSAVGLLFFGGSATAVRADEKTIVIREESLLQRMAISPDGKVVATVGVTREGLRDNSTVKLRDMRTGDLIRAFDVLEDSHLEIAFSREFLVIAVSGGGVTHQKSHREIRLHDAASGELRHKIDGSVVPEVHAWTAQAFSFDGRRLAAAGLTKEGRAFIKLWHIEKDRLIARDVELQLPPADPSNEVISAVYCLAFTRDDRTIAAGGTDGKIRLFSGVSGEHRATLDSGVPGLILTGIAFAPDGQALASASEADTVQLWDVEERKVRQSLKAVEKPVLSIAFSPDGHQVATGGRLMRGDLRTGVFLRDLRTGQHRQVVDTSPPANISLTFSPDGKTLVVCTGEAAKHGTAADWKPSGELWFINVE